MNAPENIYKLFETRSLSKRGYMLVLFYKKLKIKRLTLRQAFTLLLPGRRIELPTYLLGGRLIVFSQVP